MSEISISTIVEEEEAFWPGSKDVTKQHDKDNKSDQFSGRGPSILQRSAPLKFCRNRFLSHAYVNVVKSNACIEKQSNKLESTKS